MSSLLIAIRIISQMDPVIGTQKNTRTILFIIGSTSGVILKVTTQSLGTLRYICPAGLELPAGFLHEEIGTWRGPKISF